MLRGVASRVWLQAVGLLALQGVATGSAVDEVAREALLILAGRLSCLRAAQWWCILLSTPTLWLSIRSMLPAPSAPLLLPSWLRCCTKGTLFPAKGALSVAAVDLPVARAVLRSVGFVGIALSLAQGVQLFGNSEDALSRELL